MATESNEAENPPRYAIGQADAIYLLALIDNPDGLPDRSAGDLMNLLVNVCKLAESLSDNCREWLEVTGIIHGNLHPYTAEKLNIPTLKGALSAAVTVPRVEACGMCHTCAFRVGSPANQTEATASDVMECLQDGTMFYCHDVPDDRTPHVPCKGFVAALKNQRTASLQSA